MKKLSPGSEKLYSYWQDRFRDWLNGGRATVETGEAFLASLEAGKLKVNTIGCAARALRRMGLNVPAPSIEIGEPRYLTLEQVKRLNDAARTLLEKTIIIVCFGSGCRISEVLSLELTDLELDIRVATVTRKGGHRQRVTLGKQATEALTKWLAERKSKSRRVFMDYTYQDVYRMLRQTAKRAGFPEFTIHQLRHSRGIHLRDAGRTIADVAEVLGHTDPRTTYKYYFKRKAEDREELLVDF